jgi:hypothetical protein
MTTTSPKVDAAVEKAAIAAAPQLSGLALYSRFALSGAVCCSITHGALTPVDVYVASSFALPGPRTLKRPEAREAFLSR